MLPTTAPKPKTSKPKATSSSDASLEFDVDWSAEHARQVHTQSLTHPLFQILLLNNY
jgi:hypothetical protein